MTHENFGIVEFDLVKKTNVDQKMIFKSVADAQEPHFTRLQMVRMASG